LTWPVFFKVMGAAQHHEGISMPSFILAIDQGTTSSRAMIFDQRCKVKAIAQQEFKQHFPKPGWVEHEPEDLWKTVVAVCRAAMRKSGIRPKDIAALGITNQRETTIVWDKKSGKPIYRAIVWQDRRTADICLKLRQEGNEPSVAARTGLLLDPYFSGTKLTWILDNIEGARRRAEKGELAFGTVDSFLIWRLTGGREHLTDATNASRTLLYNIHSHQWDSDLLKLFGVPRALLPEVRDSAAEFGQTASSTLGSAISICGNAGDQQAATVGQACFRPGMIKSTYGTGCFAMLNTGEQAVQSRNRLLTTIAYQLDGRPTYALEGSIFIAGAAVQWLRDGLKLIRRASDSTALARKADPQQPVYLVPAFVGLGAPYWDAEARGLMYGLTRGTSAAELCRAALESVAFQTRDLLEAMQGDWGNGMSAERMLRVDGGMTASDWTMQFLADILNAPVDRPKVMETTALGAAYLAGLKAGIYPGPDEFARSWRLERRFIPRMKEAERAQKYAGWKDAVSRTLRQK
jgi:glycerol kinase